MVIYDNEIAGVPADQVVCCGYTRERCDTFMLAGTLACLGVCVVGGIVAGVLLSEDSAA